MSRIAARFARLAKEGRGALIPYLQAYDPDGATSLQLLRGMPGAGADLIEIGVPFTDPMADGPSIQAAALRGLRAGATVRRVLAMVAAFRDGDTETPVILMGYLNPVLAYGPARFLRRCGVRRGGRPDRGRPAERGGRLAGGAGGRTRLGRHPPGGADHG